MSAPTIAGAPLARLRERHVRRVHGSPATAPTG